MLQPFVLWFAGKDSDFADEEGDRVVAIAMFSPMCILAVKDDLAAI